MKKYIREYAFELKAVVQEVKYICQDQVPCQLSCFDATLSRSNLFL